MTSTLVAREPCPVCGSRDNLGRFDDGHGYCFGCNHYEHGGASRDAGTAQGETRTVTSKAKDLLEGGSHVTLKSRKIDEKTCVKWDYRVIGDYQVANYRDLQGNVVGQKLRGRDKTFSVRGSISGLLYGAHLWRDGGRRIVVTEGEIDALSVSQAFDLKWPVVSLPNGAQSAKKALSQNLEWLNKYEHVVLCFDMDDAGRKAVDECVSLFPPGKLKIVNLPLKDANDMLVADRVEELVRCLWDARDHRPDGIVTLEDIRSQVLTPPEEGLPWCIPALTAATYGRRYGELVALGAGTGVGKTTLLTQQIAMDLQAGHAVGVFAFEQMPAETVKRVAGQMVGRTFHIPRSGWFVEELNEVLDSGKLDKLYLYDHFGACSWDVVRERIRFLHHAHGVNLFYLDHLTALAAGEADERVALEKIMAELGGLVKELKCWLLFVSHLATPEGTPHEEGGRVTIRHFKGSRSIGFWSHFMFGLERDQQSDEPESRGVTTFRVLKDRFTGQATGLTLPLSYNQRTGLLVPAELTKPNDFNNEVDPPF
jgi:twinkle protein